MKLTYDPRHNVAYIRLADAGSEVETLRISEELSIDLAPDGRVYGIELLNANQQLADMNNLVLENEDTGKTIEVSLP